MKNNSNKSNAGKAIVEAQMEVMEHPARLFVENGERVTIADGAKPTAADFSLYIRTNADSKTAAGSRMAFAFYEAGQMPEGEKLQAEIVQLLQTEEKDEKGNVTRLPMTRSAVYQVTSIANTLVPLIANGTFKTPLSVLKDAVGSLTFVGEGKEKKLAPMDAQNTAGKAVIPLLKAGASQAKIRAARADISKAEGGTKKVAEIPAPTVAADPEAEQAKREAVMLASLAQVATFISEHVAMLGPVWRDKAGVHVCAIGRAFGWDVKVPTVESKPAQAK